MFRYTSTIIGSFAFAFAISAQANPISGVTIYNVSSELTASNSGFDRAAIHVVDGSGLDALGQHTNAPDGTMWDANTFSPSLTTGPTDTDPSITFDLGSEYALTSFNVWNFNSFDTFNGIPFTARGIKNVDISTSNDGSTYTDLGTFLFSQAPGTSDYLGELISLNVTTQFVRFNNLTNYANDLTFGVGLSEVQFFGSNTSTNVPEPATIALFSLGFAGMAFGKRRKLT